MRACLAAELEAMELVLGSVLNRLAVVERR
jgi:hypothetical protein